MRVEIKKNPGKNFGIEFIFISKELSDSIANFIQAQISRSDAPYQKVVLRAQPFVQGRSDQWLFIEFWADDYDDLITLLQEKFFPQSKIIDYRKNNSPKKS